ncbi:hypothetical protein GCM10020331_003220 [Ectobacillus funiculus]
MRAINSQSEPNKVVDAIAQADLVTTAVGPNILPFISGLIAEGLRKRVQSNDKPLNIIACEKYDWWQYFPQRKKVYEKKSAKKKESFFDPCFGFPDAAVDRIVPNQTNEDKLMVRVEPFL